MKPRKIRLENFGPYQDVVVDFSHFDNVPLFLISGKTGSGKTTIFDGICYALFGETSGKERKAEQMRSLFASDKDKTRVTLDFSHQGINYTITREPKYRKKGNKNETPAKVNLEYRDNNGELMTLTKKSDVNQFITDLLHLNVDQFTQIVLLPQQKFRKFLAANSADKESVLRQVFGTEIFEKWTQEIRNTLKEKKNKNQVLLDQLKINMENIKIEGDTIKGVQDWLDAVLTLIDKRQQELVNAKSQFEKLSDQKDQLSNAIKNGQQLQADLNRQKELKNEQLQIEKKQSCIEETKQKINDLEWARDHSEVFLKVQHQRQEIDEKQSELKQTNAQLLASQQEQSKIEQEFTQLKDEKTSIEALKITQQELKNKQPLFEVVVQLTKELKNKAQEVAQQKQDIKQNQLKIDQIQDDLQKLKQQNDQFGDLANEQIKISEQQKQLEILATQLEDLQQKQAQLTPLQQKITTITEKIASQQSVEQRELQEYQKIKQEFAKYQVVYYASQLRDGEPCPVCGSKSHPHPSDQMVKDVQQITEQQVKEHEERVKQVTQILTEFQAKQRGFQSQYDELKQIYEKQIHVLRSNYKLGEASLADLIANSDAEIKQLDFRQKQLAKAREEQTTIKNKIENAENKLNEANIYQNKLQQQLNTMQQQGAALKARYEEQRKNLPKDYATLGELKQKIDQNERQIVAFEAQFAEIEQQNNQIQQTIAAQDAQLKQLQAQIQQTTTNLAVDERQLNEILKEHKVNETQFEQWLFQKDQLTELQQVVTKYNEELRLNQQLLAEVTDKIGDQKLPDLTQMEHQLQELETKTIALNRLIGENSAEIKNQEAVVEKVKSLWKKQKVQQNELDSLEELSQVVINGTSERKMGFEKFVLREYFKEVLAVGTQILTKLTAGRYAFVLQQQALRNVASETGLEIDIYDDEAGEMRSVHTLSGGESFIAALSLALALGEVIQCQNGGIQIEMLFIDEGFGSLDEEALQSALNTLRSLESQNRMIGIISHVKDLHAQIPAQINVISHNGQSEIKYRN